MQNHSGEMQSAVKYYYDINKIFMSKLGTWPTQNIFEKTLLPAIFTIFVASIGFLEFVKLSEIWKNLTEDCESLFIFLLTVGAHVKLFLLIIKNKNIEHLLSLIDYHWRVFTHFSEVKIMHEYALLGRKMSLNYAVAMFSLMSLYLMVPLIVPILNFLKPLNTSRPYIYLFDVDYSFDREIYYYPVLVHSYIASILAVASMVINDTSYISFTQHACSLFAAIGHRLENLTLTINLKKSFVKDIKVTYNKCELDNDIIYHEMTLLIWKHQLSLEYVDLVESVFKIYLLIMIIMSLICMSLLGFQIITFMNDKAELMTYIAILIGGFIHLFVLNYPGQKIMDHSADIFHKAYNMLWYKTSQRTTQLLSILLHKSFVPCTLTAGNMYVMSLQNYSSVMQATLSYFTTLSSFK